MLLQVLQYRLCTSDFDLMRSCFGSKVQLAHLKFDPDLWGTSHETNKTRKIVPKFYRMPDFKA